jgi:pectinesterase inhibitor-like protein
MASIALFFSLLTSLLFSCSMAMASADQNWTSYIHDSCSRTLYPGLCYASLSPYADQVGSDPVLLARFAMNVTLARLKPLSIRIASLRRQWAIAPTYSGNGATKSLKDCSGLVSDATDLVKKSEKEVTGLEGKVGPEVTWRISNAQTWLSAAITDEDTCTDEFDNRSGEAGEDAELVCNKLKRAKKLTSNALALVNCLVNS